MGLQSASVSSTAEIPSPKASSYAYDGHAAVAIAAA
jgi:hypothetical protein